jgi:hypothetical protein
MDFDHFLEKKFLAVLSLTMIYRFPTIDIGEKFLANGARL